MRWFSHQRRTGGRHKCITYLLLRLPRPHPFVDFLHSDSANGHILGCEDPGVGLVTPKFELGRDFCTMHVTAKFHRPMFNRLEIIILTDKLTNKQTRQLVFTAGLRPQFGMPPSFDRCTPLCRRFNQNIPSRLQRHAAAAVPLPESP